MVSRVAVEVLKNAEELREKAAAALQKVDGRMSVCPALQQLQKIYHDVLILDLEYALDQKVEQDLWNYCFKNNIVSLQSYAKVKKNNGGHVQTRLSWFLDSASGFYMSLLQEVCSVFNLDLPFMRHDGLYGLKRYINENMVVNKPSQSSCFYICQYCLVHLGDIARYRNQMIQAESFYRHAVYLGANSGHPYNQLALLEASRGDMLSTVFYYTRSIAVTHKFPFAMTNLANTLFKCTKFELPAEGSKIVASEYESAFLQFHACLYLSQDVSSANRVLQFLTQSLTPLIATQEFSPWKLIQMAVITIFMYTHSEGKMMEVRKTLSEYLIGFLNALLLPLYTISGDSVTEYFGLPAIKVLLSWFKCDSSVVSQLDKPHLWKGICQLLNSLRSCNPISPINCLNSALPEDFDLQGFQPLDAVLTDLNFGSEQLNEAAAVKLRAYRLIKCGEWLADKSTHKPIHLSEKRIFEVVQPNNSCTGSETSNSSVSTADCWKNVGRQNVAMQSLLKKSQLQVVGPEPTSVKVDWQEPKSTANWWPHGDEFSTWRSQNSDPQPTTPGQEGTYSLFSGGGVDSQPQTSNNVLQSSTNSALSHQSLWSGPGPSPLERLLEQQKQLRNGTSQYDT